MRNKRFLVSPLAITALLGSWLFLINTGCQPNSFSNRSVLLKSYSKKQLHIVILESRGYDDHKIGGDNHNIVYTGYELEHIVYDLSQEPNAVEVKRTKLQSKKGKGLVLPTAERVSDQLGLNSIQIEKMSVNEPETQKLLKTSGVKPPFDDFFWVWKWKNGKKDWLFFQATDDSVISAVSGNTVNELKKPGFNPQVLIPEEAVLFGDLVDDQADVMFFPKRVTIWSFTDNKVSKFIIPALK